MLRIGKNLALRLVCLVAALADGRAAEGRSISEERANEFFNELHSWPARASLPCATAIIAEQQLLEVSLRIRYGVPTFIDSLRAVVNADL